LDNKYAVTNEGFVDKADYVTIAKRPINPEIIQKFRCVVRKKMNTCCMNKNAGEENSVTW
jgi:hypothetical protein